MNPLGIDWPAGLDVLFLRTSACLAGAGVAVKVAMWLDLVAARRAPVAAAEVPQGPRPGLAEA